MLLNILEGVALAMVKPETYLEEAAEYGKDDDSKT